jgi:hypothetical protein
VAEGGVWRQPTRRAYDSRLATFQEGTRSGASFHNLLRVFDRQGSHGFLLDDLLVQHAN